jgi:hypothetical protein
VVRSVVVGVVAGDGMDGFAGRERCLVSSCTLARSLALLPHAQAPKPSQG